jgi:hypothetical protein
MPLMHCDPRTAARPARSRILSFVERYFITQAADRRQQATQQRARFTLIERPDQHPYVGFSPYPRDRSESAAARVPEIAEKQKALTPGSAPRSRPLPAAGRTEDRRGRDVRQQLGDQQNRSLCCDACRPLSACWATIPCCKANRVCPCWCVPDGQKGG